MAGATARITLGSERRRMASSMKKVMLNIANSDNRLYGSGRTFLPIFPTDDVALQAALQTVMTRLSLVINPPD